MCRLNSLCNCSVRQPRNHRPRAALRTGPVAACLRQSRQRGSARAVLLLAGGVALLVRRLLVLLDLVVAQPADKTGARASYRAQAGIAADGSECGACGRA